MTRVGFVIALGVALAATALQYVTRTRAHEHFTQAQRYEDIYYLPPVSSMQTLALGHREALADVLWARLLVYIGNEMGRNSYSTHLFDYGNTLLTLDPYFRNAYRIIAIIAMNRATPTAEARVASIRDGIAVLATGAQRFPDDGELNWELGAAYVHDLLPLVTDEAERARIEQLGLEHMEIGTLRGGAPAWAALANATRLRKLGQIDRAIAHLQDMYGVTRDETEREAIAQRLAHLQGAAFAEGIVTANAELKRTHERDFPYLDVTLYLLVGPRPPFDGTGLLERGFDPAVGMVTDDEPSPDDTPVDYNAN